MVTCPGAHEHGLSRIIQELNRWGSGCVCVWLWKMWPVSPWAFPSFLSHLQGPLRVLLAPRFCLHCIWADFSHVSHPGVRACMISRQFQLEFRAQPIVPLHLSIAESLEQNIPEPQTLRDKEFWSPRLAEIRHSRTPCLFPLCVMGITQDFLRGQVTDSNRVTRSHLARIVEINTVFPKAGLSPILFFSVSFSPKTG